MHREAMPEVLVCETARLGQLPSDTFGDRPRSPEMARMHAIAVGRSNPVGYNCCTRRGFGTASFVPSATAGLEGNLHDRSGR